VTHFRSSHSSPPQTHPTCTSATPEISVNYSEWLPTCLHDDMGTGPIPLPRTWGHVRGGEPETGASGEGLSTGTSAVASRPANRARPGLPRAESGECGDSAISLLPSPTWQWRAPPQPACKCSCPWARMKVVGWGLAAPVAEGPRSERKRPDLDALWLGGTSPSWHKRRPLRCYRRDHGGDIGQSVLPSLAKR
jgi:hypothetical protein